MVAMTEPAKVEIRCACKKLLAVVPASQAGRIKIQIQCPRCNRIYDTLE